MFVVGWLAILLWPTGVNAARREFGGTEWMDLCDIDRDFQKKSIPLGDMDGGGLQNHHVSFNGGRGEKCC